MKGVERIGVSVEKKLLSEFDELIGKQGYTSRSEAIRDLIRERIGQDYPRLKWQFLQLVLSDALKHNGIRTGLS